MMTAIEHRELRGITVKTLWSIVIGTAVTVSTVMGTYFKNNGDLAEVKTHQETTERVNDIRLKLLEAEVATLQLELHEIKQNR